MDSQAPIILQAEHVRMAFGGVTALDDVSLRVPERQIVALIGPNGAGKTTLLNIIAGSLEPSCGTIRFKGKRLDGRPTHERVRMGIARTFQQALVFGQMTALENVMTGCHIHGQSRPLDAALMSHRAKREEEDTVLDAMRCLNLVGLGGKADQLAGDLPFGQQRLLALARALATDPTLLLCDEPAAGLNRLEKNDLIDLLLRIRDMGITTLLVEHDMQVVMRLADWVVVLNNGRRLSQGTPAQVRRDRAVVSAYLGTED